MIERRVSIENATRYWRRSVRRMRRAVTRRSRLLTFLAILGPGMVAANAGNDAGGIATYASTGASYGYRLLWALIPVTISLAIVQEMCARMGAVTGKGLADLIRERFGVRWTALVMLALLIANAGVTVSEFVGIAAATELFGIPRYISVPIAALAVWWLVIHGSYQRVERVFLTMSLVFLSYIAAAFFAKPDWSSVLSETIRPSLQNDSEYLFTLIALIGTTISPYMQVFVQSSVVERGMTAKDYPQIRIDVWSGTIFSNLIAFFIIVSTAAALYPYGIKVDTAADAARALAPLVGKYAETLFAIGLFGASMLAAGVLPLATAYSLSEAFGFEKGVSHSFREAPIFLGIFTFLVAVGGLVAILPGLPLIRVLLVTQVINGLLLPVLLVAILRLASDRELMGQYANGPVHNLIAWLTAAVVSALSLIFILRSVAG